MSAHNQQSTHTHAAQNTQVSLPTKMTTMYHQCQTPHHPCAPTTSQAAQSNPAIISHAQHNAMQSHHICHTEQTQQHVIIISPSNTTNTLTSTCNNPACFDTFNISRIVRNNDLHATMASHVCEIAEIPPRDPSTHLHADPLPQQTNRTPHRYSTMPQCQSHAHSTATRA